MPIRIVNDVGGFYWFTRGNWGRILRFASRHGWPPNSSLEPPNWDSPTWNNQSEIVGCASLSKADSHALVDAIDRGVRKDPNGASVAKELEVNAEAMRKNLPNYDPARHAVDLVQEWLRFRDFARGSGLRVDLTD
jgi:hypothetical protein